MTAVGASTIERASFTCYRCGVGGYPLHARLGIDGFLTRQATRLAWRSGARHSFAELCGLNYGSQWAAYGTAA